MADITACNDKKCPSRTLCHRFTCEKDDWQSYFAKSPRAKGKMRCEMFWSNSTECRCNMFGMAHGRTVSCDIFEQITKPALSQKHSGICAKKRKKK